MFGFCITSILILSLFKLMIFLQSSVVFILFFVAWKTQCLVRNQGFLQLLIGTINLNPSFVMLNITTILYVIIILSFTGSGWFHCLLNTTHTYTPCLRVHTCEVQILAHFQNLTHFANKALNTVSKNHLQKMKQASSDTSPW